MLRPRYPLTVYSSLPSSSPTLTGFRTIGSLNLLDMHCDLLFCPGHYYSGHVRRHSDPFPSLILISFVPTSLRNA